MKTVAIIQARLNSTRLPHKCLMPLLGKAMLMHVVDRAQQIPGVDEVLVAVPINDMAILAGRCRGAAIFGGPEDDVLHRYKLAAAESGADRIVRLTADCPLLDPGVAGDVIDLQQHTGAPYVSNVFPTRTWPDGLDVEVFTRDALEHADADAKPDQREHVTTIMRLGVPPCLTSPFDLGRWKLSVDTVTELEFVRRVMENLEPGRYRLTDTLTAIYKSGLLTANAEIPESDDWRRQHGST